MAIPLKVPVGIGLHAKFNYLILNNVTNLIDIGSRCYTV